LPSGIVAEVVFDGDESLLDDDDDDEESDEDDCADAHGPASISAATRPSNTTILA
jgi:hypothetical protein